MAKVVNLGVLAGLGVALVASLGVTVVGTATTDQILRALSLDTLPGMHVLVTALGIVLSVAGDVLIFWWLLVRLPAIEVPRAVAVRGALLAAAGFEVLKIIGTYTIAHSAKSPTAGPFASVLAVLIWIQLVARFMLFCCAWTAVLTAEGKPATGAGLPYLPPEQSRPADEPLVSREMRLVGAGALVGAFATWVLARTRERSH
jgi:membrane protein